MLMTLQGRKLYYDLAGPETGQVVCFTHSLACDGGMWAEQLPPLLAAGYRVLRLDMRGHGGSSPVAGPYTMAQLADDVAAVLDFLGVARVQYIGLSIGGMLGQKLAAKSPELLASLILVDTAATMVASVWDERIGAVREKGVEVTADATMERWFTTPFRERQPASVAGIRNMYCRTPIAGYLGCAAAIRNMDLRADDARIVCPTLIIVGEQDPATTVVEARKLNATIKGSKLTIIPEAAHIVVIEQAAAVTRALGDWLAAQ